MSMEAWSAPRPAVAGLAYDTSDPAGPSQCSSICLQRPAEIERWVGAWGRQQEAGCQERGHSRDADKATAWDHVLGVHMLELLVFRGGQTFSFLRCGVSPVPCPCQQTCSGQGVLLWAAAACTAGASVYRPLQMKALRGGAQSLPAASSGGPYTAFLSLLVCVGAM